MANLQTLTVLDLNGGYLGGVPQSVDLLDAIVKGVYIVDDGASITSYSYPAKNSKFATQVTTSSGDVYIVSEPSGTVSSLTTSSCPDCEWTPPTASVEITSSCAKPVFVQLCDPSGRDEELIFTTAVSICVNNAGVKTTWLTRERIVWDSVTYSEVTRATEYSIDGITWSTTAPVGTITVGKCELDVVYNCTISEAYGNDLSTLLVGKNFSITKPECCKVRVTTNIGSFDLQEGIRQYSSSDFTCDVIVTGVAIVSGSCTLDKIHIISNNF